MIKLVEAMIDSNRTKRKKEKENKNKRERQKRLNLFGWSFTNHNNVIRLKNKLFLYRSAHPIHALLQGLSVGCLLNSGKDIL